MILFIIIKNEKTVFIFFLINHPFKIPKFTLIYFIKLDSKYWYLYVFLICPITNIAS